MVISMHVMYGSQLIKITHLHEVISLNPTLGKSVSNPIIA